jgi:aryl-alcohol dehydrogenase-like predicted oxidoreductase
MRYKLLGRSGLRVSELCLGTMTFGLEMSWGTCRQESQKIYEAFMDVGGNLIDTANTYGSGEEYLGEFIAADRKRVVLATKYTSSNNQDDVNSFGNHRKNMVQSIEASLRRLRTDYIDILWVHAWDFITPPEEIMRSFDDLVRLGKVLHIGVSNAPAWAVAQANTIAEMRGWMPFIGLQIEYSLIERTAERELLPMARALDIGVTAWAPLAAGWLTGKYDKSVQAERPGSGETNRLDDKFASGFVRRNERNISIAAEVRKVALETDSLPSQVALNWVRSRGVIPIFGARKADQARENLSCLKFDLSEEHIRRLNEESRIQLGSPHEFLAKIRPLVYGPMFNSIDNHRGRGH